MTLPQEELQKIYLRENEILKKICSWFTINDITDLTTQRFLEFDNSIGSGQRLNLERN